MKALNIEASNIFFQLIQKLDNSQFISLTSADDKLLFIEGYGTLKSGFGDGNVYSIMQAESAGWNIMREPEIYFIHYTDDSDNVFHGVCPYSYQMDSAGIFEKSMIIRPNAHLELNLSLQERHTEFANDWLVKIKAQELVKNHYEL